MTEKKDKRKRGRPAKPAKTKDEAEVKEAFRKIREGDKQHQIEIEEDE